MGVLTRVWYVLLFILIVGLLLYENIYYSMGDIFSLDKYLNNPEKYGAYKGQPFGRIINISQDHFYFDGGGLPFKVIGSGVRKAVYGETILFLNFRKDGIIELIDYHNYNYNHLLYILSFIAFIIFLILFFKEWKITFRGFKDA